MEHLLPAIEILLQPAVLVALLIGSLGGVIIGAIPGVGPAVAIAILLPTTFIFEPLVGPVAADGDLWILHVWWCDSSNLDEHPRHGGQCAHDL